MGDFLNDGLHKIQNEVNPVLNGERNPRTKEAAARATWDTLISRTKDVSPTHNQLKQGKAMSQKINFKAKARVNNVTWALKQACGPLSKIETQLMTTHHLEASISRSSNRQDACSTQTMITT